MLPYSVRGSRSVKQESRGWEGCFFCVSWYNRWREKHTRIDQEAKYSAELRLANIHGCSRACVSPMTADGQLVALGHSDPDLNANGRDHQELFRVWGRKGFLGLYTSPIHGHTHSWRVIVFFFFLGIIPDFYFFLSRFFFLLFFPFSGFSTPSVRPRLSSSWLSSTTSSFSSVPSATLVIFHF